jgi:hypothetical protein
MIVRIGSCAWYPAERNQSYITQNPASDVKTFKLEKGDIHVMGIGTCERLMRYVETFNGGELVPYFAIALFAGVRPSFKGELGKLAKKESAISLSNDVIRITPDVSKIRDARQVTIQPNLKASALDLIPNSKFEELAAKPSQRIA